MKPNFLFTIIFSIALFHSINAQSLQELIRFADQQYDAGNYFLAAKEYQRAMYFGEKDNIALLEDKTGNCYFQLLDYKEANQHYQWASKLYLTDSLKNEATFKKVSCEIIQNNYQMALIGLMGIDNSKLLNHQIKIKNFLLGTAYFGLEDFENAQNYFIQTLHQDSTHQIALVNEIFNNKKYLHRPNPNTALWLSVFLPGAGQLYAGDIKNSLNSIGLTTGLIILSVYIAKNYTLIDTLITIFPWVQRYYMGGYQHAEEIATQKRAINRSESFQYITETTNIN